LSSLSSLSETPITSQRYRAPSLRCWPLGTRVIKRGPAIEGRPGLQDEGCPRQNRDRLRVEGFREPSFFSSPRRTALRLASPADTRHLHPPILLLAGGVHRRPPLFLSAPIVRICQDLYRFSTSCATASQLPFPKNWSPLRRLSRLRIGLFTMRAWVEGRQPFFTKDNSAGERVSFAYTFQNFPLFFSFPER